MHVYRDMQYLVRCEIGQHRLCHDSRTLHARDIEAGDPVEKLVSGLGHYFEHPAVRANVTTVDDNGRACKDMVVETPA